ncbi:MAG TPA: membrane-bound PQQ-dependent dehydrogenase, glucose/quinate/shikimate family, partial [Herminiimonas sp.]|nr:membrane-bound PQQ-dependent dehydrogenase, glucose/quinate/shikimate family [Herminiimonas sp.]
MQTRPARSSSFAVVIGLFLIVIGIALTAGGAWLISVGGTWYYVAAGVGLILTGVLLFLRSAVALWIYALLLLATLAWAVWEAGLDWWPLAARLDVLFVLGLVLLLPWITRSLDRGAHQASALGNTVQRPARSGILFLAVVLLASLLVAIASWLRDTHDIQGALPAPRGNPVAMGEN